jgi:hypothetical protein
MRRNHKFRPRTTWQKASSFSVASIRNWHPTAIGTHTTLAHFIPYPTASTHFISIPHRFYTSIISHTCTSIHRLAPHEPAYMSPHHQLLQTRPFSSHTPHVLAASPVHEYQTHSLALTSHRFAPSLRFAPFLHRTTSSLVPRHPPTSSPTSRRSTTRASHAPLASSAKTRCRRCSCST